MRTAALLLASTALIAFQAEAMPPRGSPAPSLMQISTGAAVPGVPIAPTVPIASGSTCSWTSGGTQVSTACGAYTPTSSDLGKQILLQVTPPGVTLATSTNCPQGTGWNDGCSGATQSPLMPAFGRTTFFGTTSVGYTSDGIARQSGQASTGYQSIPLFNVAGVDFPVGPSVPAGGWLDPKGLPAATGNACGWSQITIPGTSTQIWAMECNHATNLDIENYDFSTTTYGPAATQACVPLLIQSSNSGYIKIWNNKFVLNAGCVSGTSTVNYLVEVQNQNNAPIDFEYNYLDGAARSFPGVELDLLAVLNVTPNSSGNGGVVYVPGTTNILVAKYNYMVHVAGRPIGSNTYGSIDAEDNYAEGWAMPGTSNGIHGELIGNARVSPTVVEHMPKWTYINNTMLGDADALAGQGSTMLWVNTNMGSDTSVGDTIDYLYDQYNVTISNLSGGQGGSNVTGTIATYIESTNVANAFVDRNFMDPGTTGSLPFCFRDTVPYQGVVASDSWLAPGGSYTNYNMISGVAQKHWSIDGWSGVPHVSADCDAP